MFRWVLRIVAAVIVSLAALTYVALEASGVVVVETDTRGRVGEANATSELRETRIWFVRDGGELLLEAGHPNSPWVRDLERVRTIRLVGGGIHGEYRFTIEHGAEAHRRIRELMRRKYGWRDRWVAFVADVSRSRLVRLERVASNEAFGECPTP